MIQPQPIGGNVLFALFISYSRMSNYSGVDTHRRTA